MDDDDPTRTVRNIDTRLTNVESRLTDAKSRLTWTVTSGAAPLRLSLA